MKGGADRKVLFLARKESEKQGRELGEEGRKQRERDLTHFLMPSSFLPSTEAVERQRESGMKSW